MSLQCPRVPKLHAILQFVQESAGLPDGYRYSQYMNQGFRMKRTWPLPAQTDLVADGRGGWRGRPARGSARRRQQRRR